MATRLAHGRLASPFTAREVYRQEWTGLTEPRVVQAALECLEELGWIRSEAFRPPDGGDPRYASTSTLGSAPTGLPDPERAASGPRRPEAPAVASATNRPDRPGVMSVLSGTRAAHPVAHRGAAKRSRTG